MKNILGLFNNIDSANAAIDGLETYGYTSNDISVITRSDVVEVDGDEIKIENETGEGIKDAAKTGGVIGGILGLLVGVGALTLPGVGALMLAGPVFTAIGITGVAGATASGAATGALVGGIAGALKELGVDEPLAQKYEEGIKQGEILLAVRVHDDSEDEVKTVFKSNGGTDIENIDLSVKNAA